MGKAMIVANQGAGLYRVRVEHNRARIEAELERLTLRLTEIEPAIAERRERLDYAELEVQERVITVNALIDQLEEEGGPVNLVALIAAHNEIRVARGLSQLIGVSSLHSAAQDHATWLAQNDRGGHEGSGGSSPSQRIAAAGYPWQDSGGAAENVAVGVPRVDAVVTAWMQSPGHAANIVSAAWEHIGVGYACNSGSARRHFWVVCFGRTESSVSAGQPIAPALCVDGASPGPETMRKEIADLAQASADRDIARLALAELETKKMNMAARKQELAGLPDRPEQSAWCADYMTALTGTVATAEIPGEGTSQLLIRPAYQDGAIHQSDRDGQLFQRAGMSPEQAFLAAAILPGWQKWMPTYRIGVITAINAAQDTASVTLDAALSSAQELPVNVSASLTGVPILYMNCNARAFGVGDRVLVEFQGQNAQQPRIIGFESDPRACPMGNLVATAGGVAYMLRRNVAWSAETEDGDFGGQGYWISSDPLQALSWGRADVYENGDDLAFPVVASESSLSGFGNTILTAFRKGPFVYVLTATPTMAPPYRLSLRYLSSGGWLQAADIATNDELGRGRPWFARIDSSGQANQIMLAQGNQQLAHFVHFTANVQTPNNVSIASAYHARQPGTIQGAPSSVVGTVEYECLGAFRQWITTNISYTTSSGGNWTAILFRPSHSGSIDSILNFTEAVADGDIYSTYIFSQSEEFQTGVISSSESLLTVSVPWLGVEDLPTWDIYTDRQGSGASRSRGRKYLERNITVFTDMHNPVAAILRVEATVGHRASESAPSDPLTAAAEIIRGTAADPAAIKWTRIVAHYLWVPGGSMTQIDTTTSEEVASFSIGAGDPIEGPPPPDDWLQSQDCGSGSASYAFEINAPSFIRRTDVAMSHIYIPHDADGNSLLVSRIPGNKDGCGFDPTLESGDEVRWLTGGSIDAILGSSATYKPRGLI